MKISKTVIQPVLMYGVETWALRKKEIHLMRIENVEMGLGMSLLESCASEEARKSAEVICITEKLREARLRWFGHMLKIDEGEMVPRSRKKPVGGEIKKTTETKMN